MRRNLNRPTSIKETELVINNLPKEKTSGSDGLIGKFYPTLREEISSILYNLSQKTEAKEKLLNSVCEPSITLILYKLYKEKMYKNKMQKSLTKY